MPPFMSPLISWYVSLATTYVVGLVTAPYVAVLVNPLLRGTVKTTIRISSEVKKLATEAVEDFQNITAEANAEFTGAEVETRDSRAGRR